MKPDKSRAINPDSLFALYKGGLEVPPFSSELQARISAHLPAHGSAVNPIDVTTTWQRFPQMYGASARALLQSGEVDAVVAVLVHRAALSAEVGDELNACKAEW
jgi:acetyltransferase